MTTKELSCADRISASLASTEEDLKEIYSQIDGGDVELHEEAYESLYDYALGIDTRKETVITLSWGGPASYLEVTHKGTDIISITYRFSDWFDTATQELVNEKSALWRYAQEIINIQEGEF